MNKLCFFLIILFFVQFSAPCQDKKKITKKEKIEFTLIKQIPHTSIKNQSNSGTCWSFGTTSFFEAELIRLGIGEFDLSEMFVVKHVYLKKAINFVRYHGKTNFSQGSLPRDWIEVVKRYGIIPEAVFDGKQGKQKHNHSEMFSILNSMIRALLRSRTLSPYWKKAFSSVLSAYMGKTPTHFIYHGKQYNSKTFMNKVLKLNLNNYIEITSFTHHPYYEKCCMEVPDNWARHNHYYNLPIDEMMQVLDHALANGYTVAWDGDVSEKTFYGKKGYALIPKGADKKGITQEKEITQDMRQENFDNFKTTDDHLMHIVGIAQDKNKKTFYYTKNSWSVKSGQKGYWYLSKEYVKLKTLAIMIHKDAIPKSIKDKLGMK